MSNNASGAKTNFHVPLFAKQTTRETVSLTDLAEEPKSKIKAAIAKIEHDKKMSKLDDV